MPVRGPPCLKISSPSIRGPKNNIRETEAKSECRNDSMKLLDLFGRKSSGRLWLYQIYQTNSANKIQSTYMYNMRLWGSTKFTSKLRLIRSENKRATSNTHCLQLRVSNIKPHIFWIRNNWCDYPTRYLDYFEADIKKMY